LSISKITNTGRVSTRDLHHIYDGRINDNNELVGIVDFEGSGIS